MNQSPEFKDQALFWARQFDTVCLLDNNSCANAFDLNEIEFALAVGVKDSVTGNGTNDWEKMKTFIDRYSGEFPVFGFLAYDLKNQVEDLESVHPDYIGFPDCFLFVPEHVILSDNHQQLMVMSEKGEALLDEIRKQPLPDFALPEGKLILKPRVDRSTYISQVEQIKEHIIRGDVYELNYCVEYYNENAEINPEQVYLALKDYSPTPFGAYLKYDGNFLLCASPERFLKKSFNKLYSQPIKGTARRSDNPEEDIQIKNELRNSEKEKAENLMIVDLVRNDLAKSSETGSVQVDELFGIYTFRQVHQMISTVSSTITDGIHPVEAIENAFPMGSMTGAPKVMAMKLIEKFETTRRGLYSGAVGYFAPNEDFDLNVVIRSIQYNSNTGYLNFEVGSAITFDSNPAYEYEECQVKAKAMLLALNGQIEED